MKNKNFALNNNTTRTNRCIADKKERKQTGNTSGNGKSEIEVLDVVIERVLVDQSPHDRRQREERQQQTHDQATMANGEVDRVHSETNKHETLRALADLRLFQINEWLSERHEHGKTKNISTMK
jgi:hypothetical protein